MVILLPSVEAWGDQPSSTGAAVGVGVISIATAFPLPLPIFRSQCKLPTVAVEGEPSKALRAAASTNLPLLGSDAPVG
jgi:hypothetical protein